MPEKVVSLPGKSYQLPERKAVAEIVSILEDALAMAREGKIIGMAITWAERDPSASVYRYHAEQESRFVVSAGLMALAYSVGRDMVDEEEG